MPSSPRLALRDQYLAADQKALAQRFASRELPTASPAWPGARRRRRAGAGRRGGGVRMRQPQPLRGGDHVIFVGDVESCSRREGAQPLIFHGGRYYTELPL